MLTSQSSATMRASGASRRKLGWPVGGEQVAVLLGEAVDRPLVRRAVDPDIGDRGHPLGELLVEVDVIDELPAGQEVALEVLHAGLDLALGLRPIGPAQPRLEAPVVGEGAEGGVPDDAPLLGALAHRAGPVVEMLAGVAAEVLEGPLVGVEELGQRLVGAGLVEAAPAEAQREHEDVPDARLLAEGHRGRAPVDLALRPGRRLEARHRALGQQPGRPQGPDEALTVS